MTPSDLAKLLSPNGIGCLERALCADDSRNIEEFLQWQWQVVAAVIDATYLQRGRNIDDLIPGSLRARFKSAFHLARIQNVVIREIADAFDRASIPYCLLKGSAVRWIAYGDPALRTGYDIDIGVPKSHIIGARTIIEGLGFSQCVWLEREKRFVPATAKERKWVEDNHYELGYIIRRQAVSDLSVADRSDIESLLSEAPNPWHVTVDGRICVYLNVDIHHGISQEIEVAEIVNSASLYNGLRLPSMSWLLFHLVFKIYWEGVFSYGKGLYQYADICRLWRHVSDTDFDLFEKLTEKWRLEAAAFYVLRRLPRSFGVELGERATEYLRKVSVPRPCRKPQEENDMGDVWPKLWKQR